MAGRARSDVRTSPIVAARVDFDPVLPPRAPAFGDVYHPRQGAFDQATGVFLAGNGLPERWRGRRHFAIAETGFGLGNNFLAAWSAWRDDPARCDRLTFVSVEKHPLTRPDLARAHAASPLPSMAQQLLTQWPPLTPNLHVLDFDDGRVRLLLGFGEAVDLLRHLVARIDAFFLDGFAPARNPAMWSPDVFKALARLAAPDATVATWTAARAVRDGLAGAGFAVQAARGQSGKRDITLARFTPRFVLRPPPGRVGPAQVPEHALVVGGGLAGAATAQALARAGVPCTVLERHQAPAADASGNPAGLWHGTVAADDGVHARFLRAAALLAAPTLRDTIPHGVPGATLGLLRLEHERDFDAMRSLIERQGLPADFVQALSASQASEVAGLKLPRPAWWFAHGGWVDPAVLCRHGLASPGVRWRGGAAVQRLARHGEVWQAFDGDGRVLAQAPVVVLCNAMDTLRLGGLPRMWLQARRGQVSWCDAADVHALPHLPLAGGGYLLPLPDGRLLIGATNQSDDGDAGLRAADHDQNIARATALIGRSPVRKGAAMAGRVGWRAATRDRLPLIGLAPDMQALRPARRDAARLFARQAGLFVHSGLGSRGLTISPLGAALIAAQVTGTPWPLEADLADAIDPARFMRRDEDQAGAS